MIDKEYLMTKAYNIKKRDRKTLFDTIYDKLLKEYEKSTGKTASYALKSKIKNEEHMMNITFNLNKIKYNKKIFSVSDKDYIIQQIKIRLRTSLGELPLRKTFGSTLETQMHKDIQDKIVQKNIENIVSSIVSEFLKNYSIKVIPYIDRNNGYYQTFKINIYSNNSLILEYEME